MDDDMIQLMEEFAQANGQRGHAGYVLHNNNSYTPKQWEKIKAGLPRKVTGIPVLRVSDSKSENPSLHRDPVAVVQMIIGIPLVTLLALALLSLVALCILPWVMA